MKKSNSKEVDFLNFIYKNSEMGLIGIDDVITMIDNEKFEELLKIQREEYEKICKEARRVLKKYNSDNDKVGLTARIGTAISSEMTKMSKDKVKTVAKLMMEGTNKGIIEITEKLNIYKDMDEEIVELAKKLKETEEQNIENLKDYL